MRQSEFNNSSNRSYNVYLESKRLWHIVYSNPCGNNNLLSNRHICCWLYRHNNSNPYSKSIADNCSYSNSISYMCQSEFNNSRHRSE